MWVTGDTGNAVRNADTVLVLFGPRNSSGEPFCSAETGRIIEGMQRYGVRRILCVTGAMIGAYPENRTRFFQLLTDWVQRHYPVMMDDRAQQERLVQESGLDWTIFKPPRLSGADASGRIVLGSSVTVGMLSKVSRADLAAAMLDEVVQGRFVGQCAFVRNV